ncbi:MAG: hypothetical protein ACKO9B_00685 [Planctomycetota bacterium]
MFRNLVRDLLPHGLVVAIQGRRRAAASAAMNWEEVHRARHEIIRRFDSIVEAGKSASIDPHDYEQLIDFHVARGLSRVQVSHGSMPGESLRFISDAIRAAFHGTPICGLHVGNYVGISLAYLTATLQQVHTDSRMCAIALRTSPTAAPITHSPTLRHSSRPVDCNRRWS